MSKIAAKLKNQPGKSYIFNHNGQVKEFLMTLGLEAAFSRSPLNSSTERTMQVIQHLSHETHFVVVQLCLGCDDPAVDGYVAMCLPKATFSLKEFQLIYEELHEQTLDTGFWESRLEWS